MEQRITLVTLGVRDLARARRFYEALGWQGQEVERTVFFQAGGLALVLWDRELLAEDCGLPSRPSRQDDGPGGSGFGGIALAHNVRSPAEVDQLLAAVEAAGGTVTKPAAVNAIGFYSSAFTDPDGHAWEVAHNPGFTLAADGSLTLPDFGAGPGRPQEGSGPVRFEDTYVSRADRFSLGVEADSDRYYLSIPVSTGVVDYEEHYELSEERYRAYLADPRAALPFAAACRRREHDDLLLLRPGRNRGTPV